MTPEDLLRKHAPKLLMAVISAPPDFRSPSAAAALKAALDDGAALDAAAPEAAPLPGEAAFWWCVGAMTGHAGGTPPEPGRKPSPAAIRRAARFALSGEPLPDGHALDAPCGARAARLAAFGAPGEASRSGRAVPPRTRFAIDVGAPRDAFRVVGGALRAVLRSELPWRRARRGERVPLGELFPLRRGGDPEAALAGRLFARIAARNGPGLKAACGSDAPLAVLAPGASVAWLNMTIGGPAVFSQAAAPLAPCAEAVSALSAEAGLDPVAFDWLEWHGDDGILPSAGFRAGWGLCPAEGPRLERFRRGPASADRLRQAAAGSVSGPPAKGAAGAKLRSPSP